MKKPSFTVLLERASDLMVVASVAAILTLMIAPVPTVALDGLIAVNLSGSVVILLLSLFLREAVRFPSFPTVILLATLFRLGLNVASTKRILRYADAGEIIDAFGDVVVGGNPVVGGIVFLILVIIQFVVIAKGAERVSEVSARFSVDMMPGKQMAIDGDLSAGEIKAPEAGRRRSALEREAKLYGATEGAMKFVKGDAIAGIVISCVNILGGLVIGTVYLGMSLSEAVTIFTVLTIGDGLISQIPALLNATAAGLVVTRVAADDEEESNVGLDLVRQVVGQPKAIAVCAALLLAFGGGCAVLPIGFPWWPFMTLGVLAAGVAVVGYSRLPGAEGPAEEGKSAVAVPAEFEQPLAPFEVRYHFVLSNLLASGPKLIPKSAPALVEESRRKLSAELGFSLPPVRFSQGRADLLPRSYELRIWGAPVDVGIYIADDQAFLPIDPESLGGDAVGMRWPGRAVEGSLIAMHSLGAEGKPLFAPGLFVEHVERTIRRYASRFMGIQEAHVLLEKVRKSRPELVDAVVPKTFALKDVADVLRALLEEGTPIRDLRAILEAMARWPKDAAVDPELVAERVRRELGAALVAPFVVEGHSVESYAVARDVEDVVVRSPRGRPDADAEDRIVRAFEEAIDVQAHLDLPPLVVVQDRQARRPLARLLADRRIEAVVLVESDVPAYLEMVTRRVVTLAA